MDHRELSVLMAALFVTSLVTGIVAAEPPRPGTEDNGLTENESATLWSRDADNYISQRNAPPAVRRESLRHPPSCERDGHHVQTPACDRGDVDPNDFGPRRRRRRDVRASVARGP